MKKIFPVVISIFFLSSCGLTKAIDYSFYVPEHGEYEIQGHCFGIEDQPGVRLLITDCGGYVNVLTSTLTMGLSHSSERTTATYKSATNEYLGLFYEECEITSSRDLGGRMFEFFYSCPRRKESVQTHEARAVR
ncbi:MAG: hypothetical protein CMQ50_10165 [Gammaproteobacteria bacterium]|nr:hypothetical protein [Gammaproteobacteria bacterium]